jgi:hypothetical protein
MRGEREMDLRSAQHYIDNEFPKEIQALMRHDAGEIYVRLLEEQYKGNEWTAYPDAEGFDKNDMRFFSDYMDAYEYCHEGSPINVDYDFNSIARLLDALEPIVEKDLSDKMIENQVEDTLSHDIREARAMFENDLFEDIRDMEKQYNYKNRSEHSRDEEMEM